VAQLIAIQISQSQRDTTIWRNLVGHRVEMEWQRSRAQDTRDPIYGVVREFFPSNVYFRFILILVSANFSQITKKKRQSRRSE